MPRKALRLLAALVVFCGTVAWAPERSAIRANEAETQSGGFIDLFDRRTLRPWRAADFTMRAKWTATAWRDEQVLLLRDETAAPPFRHFVELSLRPNPRAALEGRKPFLGAELSRVGPFAYGRYEVLMQAARGSGLNSTFFTYTGPFFGDPHDEIDFEILGRDTTKVWLNLFRDGEKMGGVWADLGFDAAERPALYVFEWRPEGVTWYVDGQELLRAPASETAPPDTPGRLYVSLWAGSDRLQQWLGPTARDQTGVATYYCVSFRPFDAPGPQCSDYATADE